MSEKKCAGCGQPITEGQAHTNRWALGAGMKGMDDGAFHLACVPEGDGWYTDDDLKRAFDPPDDA